MRPTTLDLLADSDNRTAYFKLVLRRECLSGERRNRLIENLPRRCGSLVASRDLDGLASESSAALVWLINEAPTRQDLAVVWLERGAGANDLKSDMPAAVLQFQRREGDDR